MRVRPSAVPVPVKWSLASTVRLVAVKSPLFPASSLTVPVIEREVPARLALPLPARQPALFNVSAASGGGGLRRSAVSSPRHMPGHAARGSSLARGQVRRAVGGEAPRHFKESVVTVDDAALPDGVALSRVIG